MKPDLNTIRNIVQDRFLKPIIVLDKLITQNLHDADIKTRPGASNGLWCFILLPTVLNLYSLLYEGPATYKLAACLSVALLVYCILFYLFMSVSCLVLSVGSSGGGLVSGFLGSILVYNVVKDDIFFVLIFVMPSAIIFSKVLCKLLSYPSTFTIGEAMVVTQGIVIAVTVMVAQVFYNLGDSTGDPVNAVVNTVLSTVGLIVIALSRLKEQSRTKKVLMAIFTAAAGFALVQIHLVLGIFSIPRIIQFLLKDSVRVGLLAFWLFLVLVAILILVLRTQQAGKASSGTRKTFHALAAVVFASGILIDLRLMEMAAGVGLGVLILVEALRKSEIEPISSSLQSAFLVYSDKKDCGSFAVTPMYMYVGLGFGLCAPRRAPALERLAGVLAVGVGDSAASWGGERYGRCKWPGENRTLEGTLFNIVSQVLTVYCLCLFGLLDSKRAVMKTIVAATVTSLVEAKTDQVDNLILPLIMLITFQATNLLI